jgi:peptidoglycan/xylan/chitin deacetylase (PgdA/CDA1 family)
MYFNNSNNFFHGIMFHHFHDDNLHSKGQGSISKDDFYSLIKFIGKKNILDADIFFEKLKKNQLKANEVCLTFDDAVKCQIDIALPVLEDLKIKSFFFVYTSLFSNDPDNLEVFRFFRMNYYNHINDFYDDFYVKLDQDLKSFFLNYEKEMNYKKRKSPHYSIEDIKFRFVRDVFLKKEKYNEIMFSMMIDKNFEPKKFYNKLFFNNQDLKNLNNLGHLVGLHSHTHPTLFESLNYDNQQIEYEKALSVLCKILNKSKKEIKWMSHPNGSYNLDTLEILKNLGIELGFKQIMAIEPEKGMKKINNSRLEIARENHSAIMKRMI